MEAEVVRYLLKEEKGKRAVLARLVLYCAPFLKRLKISAMIWMPEELLEELETLIDEMGILCERMDQKSGKVLIFLYREETLCRYLMRESQEAFLLKKRRGDFRRRRGFFLATLLRMWKDLPAFPEKNA